MTAPKGYLSIIRYCPDISTGVSAPVGLVILIPGKYLYVGMAATNMHTLAMFGEKVVDDVRLTHAKGAIRRRILADLGPESSLDDLIFVKNIEGNQLLLSEPGGVQVPECPEYYEGWARKLLQALIPHSS